MIELPLVHLRLSQCGHGVELARTKRLERMTNGANLVPGLNGRFYFLAKDGTVHEINTDGAN